MNILNGGKKRNSKKRNLKKGGSFLADASVPASLFLLHRYLKNRKSRKVSKKSKKSRKQRTVKK